MSRRRQVYELPQRRVERSDVHQADNRLRTKEAVVGARAFSLPLAAGSAPWFQVRLPRCSLDSMLARAVAENRQEIPRCRTAPGWRMPGSFHSGPARTPVIGCPVSRRFWPQRLVVRRRCPAAGLPPGTASPRQPWRSRLRTDRPAVRARPHQTSLPCAVRCRRIRPRPPRRPLSCRRRPPLHASARDRRAAFDPSVPWLASPRLACPGLLLPLPPVPRSPPALGSMASSRYPLPGPKGWSGPLARWARSNPPPPHRMALRLARRSASLRVLS